MELTSELKNEIWQRQKGMCGQCGQKFEQLDESADNFYLRISLKEIEEESTDSLMMLCRNCHNSTNHIGSESEEGIDIKRYLFPYANFASYDYDKMLGDVRADIASCLETANDESNWRKARPRLRELTQSLKSITFLPDDYNAVMTELNQVNEGIRKWQSGEYDKFEKESTSNFDSIRSSVDEIIVTLATATEFKYLRENLIDIKNKFNALKLKKEHRETLITLINQTFEELNKRQSEEWEKFEMECSENFFTMKSKVESAIIYTAEATNFKHAREALIALQNEIKDLKLKRENRDELYSKIRESFENLNERQSVERESFERESEENYAKLKSIVDEAINLAESMTDYQQARETLIAAQGSIKGIRLKKEQRDELYSVIRVIFNSINEKQSEERNIYDKECNENYAKLTSKVDEAIDNIDKNNDFGQIRDTLIAVQSEIKIFKLRKNQRNELFSRIRGAFNIFDQKRQNHRERIKTERQAKLGSIAANLKNKITRIHESIERDKESLEFQETKITEVRSGDKESEIKDEIGEKIRMIEARINDKVKSIDETQKRITEIEEEINNL
ncbi:MAG: hypothetical protein QG635_1545 [Bacteroidota bacterium]|nr:hypothetical protein [Bacteroidota bacterium]